MAKSDFICGLCKQVRGVGFIGSGGKYKCPKHKFICADHVGGFLASKCKECGSKVIDYKFNSQKGKWEQT